MTENKPFISIVSPVYRAENTLYELVSRIEKTVKTITNEYEIILVDDRSPDFSWIKMSEISKQNPQVRSIRLSRNFGQHYAITAGLEHAKGEWIVVMDCDLQDVPEEISKLYAKTREGFEIVLGRREARKDSFTKVWTSRIFYMLFGFLTGTEQDSSVANFGIYHRTVVDNILKMGDYFRVFPVLVQWVGFNKAKINVSHSERRDGKSNYNISKLLRLATDMVISFSEKPLVISLTLGLLVSLVSFSIGIIYLISYLTGYIKVPGFTSIVLLITFHLGITLSFIGIVGLYIGKMSIQIKKRPLFIVDEVIN